MAVILLIVPESVKPSHHDGLMDVLIPAVGKDRLCYDNMLMGSGKSDYSFVLNALSLYIGKKVEQISLTDAGYPGRLINSRVARAVVMQELVDYNRLIGRNGSLVVSVRCIGCLQGLQNRDCFFLNICMEFNQ